MRRLVVAVAVVVVLIGIAGCFGGDSKVTGPSEATIAFALADEGDCAPSTYVGDFAFQGGSGLVVVAQDNLQCNGNSGGTPPTSVPASVVTFALSGGGNNAQNINDAGEARVAWLAGNPLFAFSQPPPAASAQLPYDIPSLGISDFVNLGTIGGEVPSAPAGIVADGSGAWIAVWTDNSTLFEDPAFPDNSPAFSSGNGDGGQANGFVILGAGGEVAQVFSTSQFWFCESMPDCLVQNSTTVFGMVQPQIGGMMSTIVDFPKATGSADTDFAALVNIPQMSIGNSALGPTGFAADDTTVVWTLSPDIHTGQVGCAVFAADLSIGSDVLGAGAPMPLLSTDAFSCAGAALDGSAAYVAITYPKSSSGNGDVLSGLGIARLDLTGGAISTLATDITGSPYDGPRRVYVLADPEFDNGVEYVVAIDPHAIGLIPEAAIEGRDDIHH